MFCLFPFACCLDMISAHVFLLFLVGFATTLKHMFNKPITVNYPEQKIPMFPSTAASRC